MLMESFFSTDTIIKLIGIIASIIALRKGVLDNSIGKRSQHKEEYELSKKFIAELFTDDQTENKKEPHPFIIEKGYQAISGERLSHKEIKALLRFPCPSLALRAFYRAGDLIELNKDDVFEYKKKYQSKKSRKRYKIWYYCAYFFYAIIAIFPFLFTVLFKISITDLESIIKFLIFIGMFVFLAISQLWQSVKMEFADDIMEEQAKLESAQPATEHTEQSKPLPGPDQEKTS